MGAGSSRISGTASSQNLHRRQLSEAQRAMVAEKIANRGKPGPRPKEMPQIGGISRTDAAKLLNVGVRTVDAARVVRTKGIAIGVSIRPSQVCMAVLGLWCMAPEKGALLR